MYCLLAIPASSCFSQKPYRALDFSTGGLGICDWPAVGPPSAPSRRLKWILLPGWRNDILLGTKRGVWKIFSCVFYHSSKWKCSIGPLHVTHLAVTLPLSENQVKVQVLLSHFHHNLGSVIQDLLFLVSPKYKMIPVPDEVRRSSGFE